MAPPRRVSEASGTTMSGSMACLEPSPSQVGQAPNGLLKENRRGSISAMVKPETGQANFSEKTMRSCVSFFDLLADSCEVSPAGRGLSANSAMASPSASLTQVSRLSARRAEMSSRTTTRSTTTSISCLYFLSRAGASAMSWNSPSILTRWKPFFISSAISLRYSPLRPRTIGASRNSRVPCGSARMRSTIWLTVWLSIGRPVAGE